MHIGGKFTSITVIGAKNLQCLYIKTLRFPDFRLLPTARALLTCSADQSENCFHCSSIVGHIEKHGQHRSMDFAHQANIRAVWKMNNYS